jgi:aerobic carbon-monoxide dehydrogenase small subunit
VTTEAATTTGTSTASATGTSTPATERRDITVTVNGVRHTAAAPPRRLLSDFLRHDLRMTGTHVGCEHGVCGCCTVLLDGEPVRSCLVFAISVEGHELTTVEGLAAEDGTLHPVQQAFRDEHGLQCGFCTPGFVMSACGFLAEDPDPDEDEIREAMSGNLCRCTGYAGILAAVKQAAGALRASGADPRDRHVPTDGDAGAGGRAAGGPPADLGPEVGA